MYNEYRGQLRRVQQAEQYRIVEYPGGNSNHLVRRPLQVINYRSERSFSKESTETRSRAAAPSPSLLDPSRLQAMRLRTARWFTPSILAAY